MARNSTITAFRWWVFKRLSELGWWVCPEPHKSRLQSVMPTWRTLRTLDKRMEKPGKEG